MSETKDKVDLGQSNGTNPDRGRSSGHTPGDHAEARRTLPPRRGPDHLDPVEKARPRDTKRLGA